jgi:3-oxoacyl-[acyl-carrier-protein] synthase II
MGNYKHRVVLTGLGVVAPNGLDRESFYQALCEGVSGLGPVDLIDMSAYRTQIAGEVKRDFADAAAAHNFDRTVSLAFQALDEALADSGLTAEDLTKMGPRAGLAFATSLGGNSRMMEHIKEELAGTAPNPQWLADLNFFTNFVARRAGIRGIASTTASACAAGTASAGLAIDAIRFGRADLMILGGADPLTDLSIGGFHSLKSLSPNGSKPFDRERDGLVIGEASAVMVLERLDHALARGAHIYAEILGYGISNDAHHITSPDPEGGGAIRAMRMALADAGLEPHQVDYINAHGTSTLVNDKMELGAIREVFGDHAYRVAISSTKSMTGHCLGAAGSIELAACVLAIDRGLIPPTATLEEPEESFEGFRLIKRKGVRAEVKVAMSNSFAFAGNSACILIGRYDGEQSA